MKKIMAIVLSLILVISFVGCSTGSVKGTYKDHINTVFIIEDDTVTRVNGDSTEFYWKKSGDYIRLTPKDGNHTFEEYTLRIVDGGVVYHYKNIETGDEYYDFYEKVK